jgi:hypothetical protein
MKTSALITLTQRKVHGYTRIQLTEFYDEIQKMVFSKPLELMHYVDSSTGLEPLLTTTAGVFEYELTEAVIGKDIQNISNVYPKSALTGHVYYGVDPTSKVVYANTKQGTGINASKARIIFNEDPGDQEWYVSCYRYPTPLTAETIQLEVPERFHLTHMMSGVIGLIETFEHGQSKTAQTFLNDLIGELQGYLSSEGHNSVRLTQGQGY